MRIEARYRGPDFPARTLAFAILAVLASGTAGAQQNPQTLMQRAPQLEERMWHSRDLQNPRELEIYTDLPTSRFVPHVQHDQNLQNVQDYQDQPDSADQGQAPERLDPDIDLDVRQTDRLRLQSNELLQRLEPPLARKLLEQASPDALPDRLSHFRRKLEGRLQVEQGDPDEALRLTVADEVRESFTTGRFGLSPDGPLALGHGELAALLGASNKNKVSVSEYHEFLRQAYKAKPGTPVLELFGPDGLPLNDVRYFSIIGRDDIIKMIIGDDGIMGINGDGIAGNSYAGTFGSASGCDAGGNDSTRAACPDPRHMEKVKRMAGAVALVTASGFLRNVDAGTVLGLQPAEHCKFQSRSHCSGFLDADRRHLWTAAHCLANLNLTETSRTGTSMLPEIDETTVCPKEARFRAVFGLGARRNPDAPLAEDSIYGCRTVTRTSHDTVRIRLDTDTDVPASLVSAGMPVYSGTDMGSTDIPVGTRLAGFGFPHTARLAMMGNGAIRPPRFCNATVASNSGTDSTNPLPIDRAYSGRDYLCISTDTLSGASGGPVVAALPNGLVEVIGVMSRAYRVELAEECKGAGEESDRLNLASRIRPFAP